MKRILQILVVAGIFQPAFAQRNADLTANFTSPQDNSAILLNEMYTLTVEMTNPGSEAINTGDSLYIYVLINGDTLIFQPDNVNHMIRTGNSIAAGGNYSFSIQSVFSMGYENTTNEVCLTVVPVNAADPIIDTNMADNTDCFTITVYDSAADLDEMNALTAEIYPVPANSDVAFSQPLNTEYVTITDLNGQIVQHKTITNNGFSVADLQNGVYFVLYEDGQSMKSIRLIVSH